jgi:hypothetical protein
MLLSLDGERIIKPENAFCTRRFNGSVYLTDESKAERDHRIDTVIFKADSQQLFYRTQFLVDTSEFSCL